VETGLRALADRAGWAGEDGTSALDATRLATLMVGYRRDAATDPAALPTPPAPQRENPAGAGFVAVDSRGSAVACVVTMNNLFGSARFAATTGVLLAAPRHPGAASLVPVIVANHNSREVLFAGASAGGVAAPAVMAQVLADVFGGEVSVGDAIRAPRLIHLGSPDIVVPEPELADSVKAELAGRGHHLSEPFTLGRVNAISCPEGLRTRPDSCRAITDRRGYGMAVGG
ncbi:MAG: gamma-glutamyltransferase, partial [Alphaproteobacteria bacterium]